MSVYLLPGVMGLLLGLLLHWTGFSRTDGVRAALGLRRSYALRSGLYAVGASMAVTALLCWLAVIDVDTIEVLPLSAGALAGGVVFGIAAGLCGCTPSSAFAALGGGAALEALSVLAGCVAMTALLPTMAGLLSPLHTAAPYSATTLFRVTLDEPFLLGGGFLGQGCAGLLLAVFAICIPSPRPVILTDEAVAERAEHMAEAEEPELQDPPAPDEAPEIPPAPEDAPAETFVALLPGEEPLVVDTELDEDAAPEEAPPPDESPEEPADDLPETEEESQPE